MRKLMILLLVVSAMMLSACSLFESANQTVKYADQAQEHMNRLSDFAEQAPQMIRDAATDPETKQQLEDRLVALKEDIMQFNLLEAPAIAQDLHQQLIEKNQVLLQEINDALANGHLALDRIQNSPIIQTISDITSLLNRIENLGL
ncbi:MULTISPECIES: DUF6376 family protein [unclassified Paenibacillus]|uniref:DUF6376 family protein n=1 Tax=unclassified Paenibacillus TaxID=185978 RepID=UPI001045CFBC|nr:MULTISPECIES: DUF6376 family protein [unclassified Paenibacillus]NIK71834.1 septation ring formation regulator EzrA [Paenibacillus sp. BK720]TCM96486.1 hypothetical protein EV294_105353 [Paenibacillus sp. BK033]